VQSALLGGLRPRIHDFTSCRSALASCPCSQHSQGWLDSRGGRHSARASGAIREKFVDEGPSHSIDRVVPRLPRCGCHAQVARALPGRTDIQVRYRWLRLEKIDHSAGVNASSPSPSRLHASTPSSVTTSSPLSPPSPLPFSSAVCTRAPMPPSAAMSPAVSSHPTTSDESAIDSAALLNFMMAPLPPIPDAAMPMPFGEPETYEP